MVKCSVLSLILLSVVSCSVAKEARSNVACSFSLIVNGDGMSFPETSLEASVEVPAPSAIGNEKCLKMLDVLRGKELDQSPNRELYLSISALVFGLMILGGFLYFRKDDAAPEEVTKTIGLTIIVTGTLFMISAGWESSQIAPAMGLFGTLAGYLLAKSARQQ